jgi:DNA-directed RNA polymerase subunit RPC12/RpoP
MTQKRKSGGGFLEKLLNPEPPNSQAESNAEKVTLQPALRQIGLADCPVCKHEVAVLLTKSKRPFINCSFCSTRIFFNGREGQRRLNRAMTPVDGGAKI